MKADASDLDRYWATVPNISRDCLSRSALLLPCSSLNWSRKRYCLLVSRPFPFHYRRHYHYRPRYHLTAGGDCRRCRLLCRVAGWAAYDFAAGRLSLGFDWA